MTSFLVQTCNALINISVTEKEREKTHLCFMSFSPCFLPLSLCPISSYNWYTFSPSHISISLPLPSIPMMHSPDFEMCQVCMRKAVVIIIIPSISSRCHFLIPLVQVNKFFIAPPFTYILLFGNNQLKIFVFLFSQISN